MTEFESKNIPGYGSKMKQAQQKSLLLSTKELKEKQTIAAQKEDIPKTPQKSDPVLNLPDFEALNSRRSSQIDKNSRETGQKVSEHIQIPIAKFEFLENEIGVTEQDKPAYLERSSQKKKIVKDFRHTQSSSTLGERSPKPSDKKQPKRPFQAKKDTKGVTLSGQKEIDKQNEDLNVRQSSVAKMSTLIMYAGMESYRETSRRGDPSTVAEVRSKVMSPYENQLNQESFDEQNGPQMDKGVGIAVRDNLMEGPKINFVTSVTLKRRQQVDREGTSFKDQTVGNLLADYDQVNSAERQFLTSQLLRDQALKFQINHEHNNGVDNEAMQEYAKFLTHHSNLKMKEDENNTRQKVNQNSLQFLTMDETKNKDSEYQQKRKLRLLDAAQAKIEHVLRQRASQSQTQKHQRKISESILGKQAAAPVTNPLRSQILAGSALSSLPEFDIKAAFDPFSQKRLRDRQYIKDRQLKSKSNMETQAKMSDFYGKYHEKMDHGFVKERIKNLQFTLEAAKNARKSFQVSPMFPQNPKTKKIPKKSSNVQQSDMNIQIQDSDTFIKNELDKIQRQESCSSPLIQRHGYNLRQRIGLGDATLDQFLPKISQSSPQKAQQPSSPLKVLAQEYQLNKHEMSIENDPLESTPITNNQALRDNLYLQSKESLYKQGRTQHKKSNETLQGSGALRSGRESVFDRMEPVNDYNHFQRFNLQENSQDQFQLAQETNVEIKNDGEAENQQPKPIKVRVSSRASNQRPKVAKKRSGASFSGQDNYNSSNEDSDASQSNRINPIGKIKQNSSVGGSEVKSTKSDQNQQNDLNNNYGDVHSSFGGKNNQFKNLTSKPSTRAGRQITTPDESSATGGYRTQKLLGQETSQPLIIQNKPTFAQQIIPVKRISIKNYDSDSSPILSQEKQEFLGYQQKSEMALYQLQEQGLSGQQSWANNNKHRQLSLTNSLYSSVQEKERYAILTPRTQTQIRQIKAQVRNREIRLKMLSKRRITDVQKQPPSDGQKGPFSRLLDPRRTSLRYKDDKNSSMTQSALTYALEEDPTKRATNHYKNSKSQTSLPIDYAEIQYQQFQNFDLIIDAERHLQKIMPTGKQISVGKQLMTPREPNKSNQFYHSSLPQEARLNIYHLKLSNIYMKSYSSFPETSKKSQDQMKHEQEFNKKSEKNRINMNDDITSVEFVMRLSKNLKLTEDFEKAADLTQQHFLSKRINRRSKSIVNDDQMDQISRFGQRKNYSPLKELTHLTSYDDKVSLVKAKQKKIRRSVNPNNSEMYGDKKSEKDVRKMRKSLGLLSKQQAENEKSNDKTDVSFRSTLIDQNEEQDLVNGQMQLVSNRTQQRDYQHHRHYSQPEGQIQQVFAQSNEEPSFNFVFGADGNIQNMCVQDQDPTTVGNQNREMVHSQYKPFIQANESKNASQKIQTAGQNSANPSGLQSWRKMDQSSFNSGSRWRISQPVFFQYPEQNNTGVIKNHKNTKAKLNATKTSGMGYVIDDKMTHGSRSIATRQENSDSIEDYFVKKKSMGPILQKRKQNAQNLQERSINYEFEDKSNQRKNFKKFPTRVQRIEKEYAKYTAETKRKALIERETRLALRNGKQNGSQNNRLVVKKELYFPNLEQNQGEEIAQQQDPHERLTVNLDINPQQNSQKSLSKNQNDPIDKNFIYFKDEQQLPSTRNAVQLRNQNLKSASDIGEEQIGQDNKFEQNFKPYNTNTSQLLYGESAKKIQKQLAASTGSGSWKSPFQQHLEQNLSQKQNRKNRQHLQQLLSNNQGHNLTNDHGLSVDSGSVNKLDQVQILNQDFLMLDVENPTIPFQHLALDPEGKPQIQQPNRAISTAQNSNQNGDFGPPSAGDTRLNHLNHSQIKVHQREMVSQEEYGQRRESVESIRRTQKIETQAAADRNDDSFAKFGHTFGLDNKSKQDDSSRNLQDHTFIQKVHNPQLVEYITVQQAQVSNKTFNMPDKNSKIFQIQKPIELLQNMKKDSTESIKIATTNPQQLENQQIQLSQNNLWNSQQDINMLQITGLKCNQSVNSSWDSGIIKNDQGLVSHLPKQISGKLGLKKNQQIRNERSLDNKRQNSSSLQSLKVSGSQANPQIQIRQNASQDLNIHKSQTSADVVINVRKSLKNK